MTTHSENRQPNTLITNSPINVQTLNVNKTSTQEAILQSLPQYYIIDLTTGTSNYEYDLSPPVNPEFSDFFKVFIDGTLIPSVVTSTDEGAKLLPNANQFQIIGTQYTSLLSDPNVTIHALYTKL